MCLCKHTENWLKCSDIVWIMSIDKSSLLFVVFLSRSLHIVCCSLFFLVFLISFGILLFGTSKHTNSVCIFISCAHFSTHTLTHLLTHTHRERESCFCHWCGFDWMCTTWLRKMIEDMIVVLAMHGPFHEQICSEQAREAQVWVRFGRLRRRNSRCLWNG